MREKLHQQTGNVPGQDQLQTRVNVSVQFHLRNQGTPLILKTPGKTEDVIRVHLVPKLRSLLREQGKTVKRAEDFFTETTRITLQTAPFVGLPDYFEPGGVEVEAVLLRDISLPPSRGSNRQRARARHRARRPRTHA